MNIYLGIDVGSITTKLAALDSNSKLINHIYRPTQGNPVAALQQGLKQLRWLLPHDAEISGVATTGSGRRLAGIMLGADLVKNEITSQAVAALHYIPQVKTLIEIGGQDSKLIIIREAMAIDFGMNTICAAGTGSFLDHQAERLNMSIVQFSQQALESTRPVSITGRCTVFAESDMIHKQQMGYPTKDIIYGLCRTLVCNYLNDVGLGKDIQSPIVFQGGVAFNQGIVRALEEEFNSRIIIPAHPEIMGAIGAALLVHEEMVNNIGSQESRFKGFAVSDIDYDSSSFECRECPICCQIAQLSLDGQVMTRWGGDCDLWEEEAVLNRPSESEYENCH